MANDEQAPDSLSDRPITRGEVYHHADHGRVKVADIWRGTTQIDSVHQTDDYEPFIAIRFTPEGGDWSDQLVEPLDEFRDAVD